MSIQGMRKRFAVHFRYVLYVLIGVFIVGLSALFSPLGGGLRGLEKPTEKQQNPGANDTIATVNGKPVTRAAVDAAFAKEVMGRQQQLAMIPGYAISVQEFPGIRQTALETAMPLALTSEFSNNQAKQTQWKAFVRRSRLRLAAEGLEQVVAGIRSFLEAPVVAASQGEKLKAAWAKGGSWKPL